MVVDQTRDDGCALDVDDSRVGTRIARHLRARAARDDSAAVDRQRLDDAEVGVDGQDLTVRDYGIDWLLRQRRRADECGEYAATYSQTLEIHYDYHTQQRQAIR